MKRILLLALSLFVCVSAAEAQRQRAVRIPAPACSFALSIAFANPVADTGVVRGRIIVTPSSGACTSWNAFSPVDWIFFEPGDAPNEAAITVRENLETTPRAARVRIAGTEVEITQLGRPSPPLIDTGLVKNGAFDTNLDHWGWQDRFPNGPGSVEWTSLDSNGSSQSGSIRLRGTSNGSQIPGKQILQCVPVQGGQVYTFGVDVRTGTTEQGVGVISLFDLVTDDCSGPYTLAFTQHYNGNGVDWTRESRSFRVGIDARSLLIVLASKTKLTTPFDVYLDDITLKLE